MPEVTEPDHEGCPHPFDDHIMIATRNDDPKMGGVVICPEEKCECFATWAVEPFSTRDDVVVPSDEELAAMRYTFQTPKRGET